MKNSLACCYLTHNHTDIIKKVLERSLESYTGHGIDIYIYDDSDDSSTKQLIDEFISQGFKNLNYVDTRMVNGGDQKMFLVTQGFGLTKEYDYIWPTKDRQCFEEGYIDRLCQLVDEDYDVILGMNEWQRWDISTPVTRDVYTDPVEFYRDYGFYMTNWECTVRKRSTMLSTVDWNKYKELYNIENNPFSQILGLFTRAVEIGSFKAAICRYDQNERFVAATGMTGWRSVIFELWIDRWIDANYSLPAEYDAYKLKVIKDETNLREIFGSALFMMNYCEDGIYNRQVFEKYRNVWPLITDIPITQLELIAEKKYDLVIEMIMEEFEQAMKKGDYLKARLLFAGNSWFKEMYDADTYNNLFESFNKYTYDMLSRGASNVFD